MSYLNGPSSDTTYGVVEIGNNIDVDSNGVISLEQSVAPSASVTFASVTSTGAITDSGHRVLTSVVPSAGAGISLVSVVTTGPSASFTIDNQGVLSLVAGSDIAITGTNTALTIADTSTLETVTSRGHTTDTVIAITNLTAASSSNTGALTVAGGVGVGGNLYAAELFDAGNRVVTGVTANAGSGISITAATVGGPAAGFTVNNTGVLSLIAGTGISLSAGTGNITVSSTGTSVIDTVEITGDYTATATDEYIGVNSTSLVTVTLPTGITGRTYIIKDEHGTGFGKIKVQGTGGQNIDNNLSYTITIPNASISVVFSGSAWRII
jgi:hypothetical protein